MAKIIPFLVEFKPRLPCSSNEELVEKIHSVSLLTNERRTKSVPLTKKYDLLFTTSLVFSFFEKGDCTSQNSA